MITFKSKIFAIMDSGQGSEAKTRDVISMLDAHILEAIRLDDEAKYWKIMRKIHEIYEGCHYDKSFAMYEVNKMQHTDKKGKVHKGQHWSIEEINEVYKKHKSSLKSTDTLYDMYVALHSWWHDNICQDMIDFCENAEEKNIERGIGYFFKDEDAPEGKIWHYYQGMRNN